MWSDSGLLLRGPEYYRALLDEDQTLADLVAAHSLFLDEALGVLEEIGAEAFTVLRWKLCLGVIDQVRNLWLAALVATFKTEDTAGASFAQDLLVDLSTLHAGVLLGADGPWDDAVLRTSEMVRRARVACATFSPAPLAQKVYRCRECDWFVENLIAAEVALRELRASDDWPRDTPVLAVGLAYGGAEFPSVLESVARRGGARVHSGLLRLSTYGEAQLELDQQIRRGDAAYVRALRDDPVRFMRLSEGEAELSGRTVVLCDDNVTTAISLQHARDVMLLKGHRVIGAAVVRYPSANRAVHMNLPGHGFPDPGALAGFVRGLVSPSPYTRLIVPDPERVGNPYRDRWGRFNKAKERLERLLGMSQEVEIPTEPRTTGKDRFPLFNEAKQRFGRLFGPQKMKENTRADEHPPSTGSAL